MNSLVDVLRAHAHASPERRFFDHATGTVSYRAMWQAACGFAAKLTQLGLGSGQRVALFHENAPDFLIAYFGTWLARGVVVLVNPAYRQTELRHILADAGARICVTSTALLPELLRVRSDLPELQEVLIGAQPADNAPDTAATLPSADDIAIIAYTSGTTGRSKGAMLLHRNLLSNALSVAQAWRWTSADHLLHMLPLFHAHGLMVGVHGTLVAGASFEMQPVFQQALAFDRLCSGAFSMFFGVPTMHTRLIAEARLRAPMRPPPLRLVVSGSAPLSPQTFADFEAHFGARILERYGMTETIMNTTNPYVGERRAGTVGAPFPGQQMRVVHVRTRTPLGHGENGEIEVKGPHVFAGYWNRPDATAEAIDADGWFATGDLGQISPDGYLSINGRAKELIISGGYNIYPREIEEVLESCPGVREVAVLGMPDAEFGEHVVAIVVRNDLALTAEALIAHCKANVASYKKPRHVVFVDALPRNSMGKVMKHVLKQHLSEK